jgi:beta-lactamase regulating signal transducer with metallopeptidase domain
MITDGFSWLLSAGLAVPAAFRSFALIAAPAAIDALWQGAAVAAGLAVCLRLLPRIAAAHRFATWAAAFAALAGLEVLPFLPHFATASSAGAALAGTAPHPWLQLDARWSVAIAALWAALAAIRSIDLLLHSIRLRRLWKSAQPIDAGREAALATLQGRGRAQVCTTRELDRPSVIGFFAPRILIPDWLYARLTPGELEQVVLHETEHLRRRDDWTNLLQKLCLVLFPLHPALAWIERRLCREREMACDEGVVRITQAPRSYAACLASLAERRLQRRREALSLGAFERRPELVHRVHSILLRKRALHPLGARALLGMLGCGLLFGAVELARCPQMVAFVPAQRLVAQAAQPVALRDAAFRGAMPAFRATNVEALVPASSRQPEIFPALQPRGATSEKARRSLETTSVNLAYVQPKQRLLKAEAPDSATDASRQPQAWAVLATWQVQSSTPEAGEAADYDGKAQSNGQAQEHGKPSQLASRITVTRLILRVYPAGPAAAAPASNSPASNASSMKKPAFASPAVLPFGNGWLVIQL